MATRKKSPKKPSSRGITLEQALPGMRGDLPPVILVGGNSDYLVSRAWSVLSETIEESHPGVQLEPWPEGADLARVAESFRTSTLFATNRILLVPEVNAFVTARELDRLVEKAVKGWDGARTDRKRKTSAAQLMHALGLVGVSLDDSNATIRDALGFSGPAGSVGDILDFARQSGSHASRGEGDAALIGTMISQGGAPGTHLALRTGEIPESSSTIDLIEKEGLVIRCDLSRETFDVAFRSALEEISSDWEITVEPAAVSAIRDLLGIDRILQDKYSKEIPDLAMTASEVRRLAAFVGVGGRITRKIVSDQLQRREGGVRFEVTSLVAEGKPVEAIEKLRDLVAQARREKTSSSDDFAYGSFVLSLADEIRVLIGVASYCRRKGIRRAGNYNQFKGTLADDLLDDLSGRGLIRSRMHPFPLYKKVETITAGRYGERALVECLRRLSAIEMERKSGGVPVQIGLETALVALGMN